MRRSLNHGEHRERRENKKKTLSSVFSAVKLYFKCCERFSRVYPDPELALSSRLEEPRPALVSSQRRKRRIAVKENHVDRMRAERQRLDKRHRSIALA